MMKISLKGKQREGVIDGCVGASNQSGASYISEEGKEEEGFSRWLTVFMGLQRSVAVCSCVSNGRTPAVLLPLNSFPRQVP
jgi:hypothetical protein